MDNTEIGIMPWCKGSPFSECPVFNRNFLYILFKVLRVENIVKEVIIDQNRLRLKLNHAFYYYYEDAVRKFLTFKY